MIGVSKPDARLPAGTSSIELIEGRRRLRVVGIFIITFLRSMSRSPRHPSSSAAAAPTATDGGGGGGGGDDAGHHHHHDVTKYAVPLTAAAIILERLLENEDVTARDVANLAMTSCSFWRVMCDAPLTRVWERVARVYVDRANCLQANYDDRVSLLGVDFSMFDVDDDSDDESSSKSNGSNDRIDAVIARRDAAKIATAACMDVRFSACAAYAGRLRIELIDGTTEDATTTA